MLLFAFKVWRILYPALPLVALVLIAVVRPQLGRRWFRRVENRVGRLARRPLRAGLLIALTAFCLSLALSCLARWPQPVIGDEFSYVLAADTFAHGRATNLAHPLWPHFESLHILQQPTYASKYPPAQGLMLAAGQVVTGWPIAGAWLGVALACAGVYWMLRAWVGPRGALLGGLLAAIHPMVLEWGQNFWGGAAAMLGGALVLGALRRMWRRPRSREGWLLGCGLAILANSRPFEGLVLSLILLAATMMQLIKRRKISRPQLVLRGTVPAMIVLAVAGAAMLHYNRRVTGNPFKMPYVLHEETYAVAPAFVFQSPRPEPNYRHAVMRDFYTGYALESYAVQRSFTGFLVKGIVRKVRILVRAYLSIFALSVPLLALLFIRRRDRMRRLAFALTAIFVVLLLAETWMLPHYAAPGAGLVFILGVCNLRDLRAWRPCRRRVGLWLARGSVVLSLLTVLNLGVLLARSDRTEWAWAARRAQLESELEQRGGQHLILVHYSPAHVSHQEWVYNRADIDAASVVWAREMGAAEDARLREYFKDRQVWRLEADAAQPVLLPLSQ